ncbi:MAG: S-layer homology domain-containing protein [Firmicutes bacterium]|nr:S-layer homology domain-containing protein [Bacillota bacterium]
MKKRSFLLCALVLALMLAFTAPLSAVAYFNDVQDGNWYCEHVQNLSGAEIISGYPGNVFLPDNNVKRAEFIKILAAASYEDLEDYENAEIPFLDAQNHWAKAYIAWGYDNGIVNGKSATSFDPEGLITRQEMAVMIDRFATYLEFPLPEKTEAMDFADKDAIADWAADAVTAMQKAQIINGYPDETFAPTKSATRAEAAKMIDVLFHCMTFVIDFDTLDATTVEFEDMVFTVPIEVRGDMGYAVFRNCEFMWDITNTATLGTSVIMDADCEANGFFIFDNGVKEGNVDYQMPKVISYVPVIVKNNDCIGSIISMNGREVLFNNVIYDYNAADWFYDAETGELIPYTGQEANVLYVGQWWEDGQLRIFIECEYDNTLVRTDADEYTYDLDEGDTTACANYNYHEDVYINGDNANIFFENCAFYGDIIITADEGTRAIFDKTCEIYGNVIFDNDVKEADMDYSMPKAISDTDISAIADDCVGSAIACGGASLNYNGTDYTPADADWYEDAEGNILEYTGQEANSIYIGQWWESGEKVLFKLCFE